MEWVALLLIIVVCLAIVQLMAGGLFSIYDSQENKEDLD